MTYLDHKDFMIEFLITLICLCNSSDVSFDTKP